MKAVSVDYLCLYLFVFTIKDRVVYMNYMVSAVK